MYYQWDEAKRCVNIIKHGVDFREIYNFDWETSLREESVRDGEIRYRAYGFIGARLHAVVYTEREVYTRIISLRKANDKEFDSMPPLKPGALRPTLEENEAINRGIAADLDNPEATAEDFARMRPMTEAAPELVARYRAEKARKARKV